MKILIITSGIYPDSESGIPKFVYNQAKELHMLGHEVIIITRKYDVSHPTYEMIKGMHYNRVSITKRGDFLHYIWPLQMCVKSIWWQRKIRRIHNDFDLVIIHNAWWSLFSNPKTFWKKSKVIFCLYYEPYSEILSNHGDSLKVRMIGKLFNVVALNTMRKKSDLIIVNSKFVLKQCLAMLGKTHIDRIKVIPGGANTKIFFPVDNYEKKKIREKLKIPLNRTLFITARGLKGRTGVDKLVEAASLLKEQGISFYLIIAGRGPLKQTIERQIKSRGLESNIRLIYIKDENELAVYYQASDVFVLPTQGGEGFGLGTVEALASGLVVLGTNNGATTEILEKYNHRWLINGTDKQSIYEKMLEFCNNPHDFLIPPKSIQSITHQNYNWKIVAKDILQNIS